FSTRLAHPQDLHSFLHDALPISLHIGFDRVAIAPPDLYVAPACAARPSPNPPSSPCSSTQSPTIRIPRAFADLAPFPARLPRSRSEEHTSELQSLAYLVCRLLLE